MKNDILSSYEKSSLNFIGNSNSLHELGLNSKKLEDAASKQILDVFSLYDREVVYTSGDCESFTFILDNIKSGNIVTDNKIIYDICLEMGKEVFYGNVKALINSGTKLVSVCSDIDMDYNGLKHICVTSCGDYNKYDFISIASDIPFFGCVIKKKNKDMVPLIHGGKSSTKYRSGTAATPLIVSFSKEVKFKYKK